MREERADELAAAGGPIERGAADALSTGTARTVSHDDATVRAPSDSGVFAEAVTMPDTRRPARGGTPPPAGTRPPEGLAFGKYHLEKELGRGGMGVVYKAHETSLNRHVALKLMLSQDVPEAERLRFLREAEASAQLRHPYIVAVHEVNVEQGKLFFSMDFVEGKTLKAVMEERRGEMELLLGIFAKVCEGVGYAHRKGIIHRDLKPANVMVAPDMTPHIMDFGLAARLDEAAAPGAARGGKKARITRIGAIMGTPSHMSPEQAAGQTAEIDTRSDIYALGVILYSILTGELPFRTDSTPVLLLRIVEDEPDPPRARNPACPWELERIALKAMAKKREDRFQTAFDLRADIEAWLEGRPVSAAGGGALYRARKFVGRHRGAVALATLGVAAVLAAGGYAVERSGAERRAALDRAAKLLAEGNERLALAAAERLKYEQARGVLQPKEARDLLASAAAHYAAAAERYSGARQLDPSLVPPADAAVGQQAVRGYDDAEIERQTRAEAARESRRRGGALTRQALATLDGVDPRGATALAAVATAKGEVDAARGMLLQALALDPASEAARNGLSRVIQTLAELGEHEKVLAQKQRLEELGREAGAALAAAAAARDDPAAARAHVGRAIAALAEGLRINAADPAIRMRRVDAALELGKLALGGRLLELAEHAVDEVRDLDPGRAAAFLVTVRRARDDERRFAKAAETAALAMAEERFKEAAAAYQEALLAAPGRSEAEFGLRVARGAAAARDGRPEEALAIYDEAAPFAASALERGTLERAETRERAAAAAKAVAAAEAAIGARRFDEALLHIARAIAFRPDDPTALRLRSEIEARQRVPTGTVLVPEGAFTFGTGAAVREGVACAAFFIGKTEVTNREYREFVRAGGYEQAALFDRPGLERFSRFVGRDGKPGPLGWLNSSPPEGGEDLPVTGISWYEARAFARWRGPGWRLPTELEWEKAATWDAPAARKVEPPWIARLAGGSVGSTWLGTWRPYFNGSAPKPAGAPFGRNEAGAPLYDRSPLDVLDVWGNVRELVVGKDPDGSERPAMRGGSFASRLEERSSAFRTFHPKPYYRAPDVGFRIAKSIAE